MNRTDLPARLLRLPEVKHVTGLSKATIYRLEAKGDFPARIRLTERSSAWPSPALAEWVEQRMARAA